jgi:hypothetical protein
MIRFEMSLEFNTLKSRRQENLFRLDGQDKQDKKNRFNPVNQKNTDKKVS